jgi:hypothetical protein
VLLSPVCRMFLSNHMCPITLAYILSISQECDITGGDIKEVNPYMSSLAAGNARFCVVH